MIFSQNLNFQWFRLSEFEFSVVPGLQNLNFSGCGLSEFEFSVVWGITSPLEFEFSVVVFVEFEFSVVTFHFL